MSNKGYNFLLKLNFYFYFDDAIIIIIYDKKFTAYNSPIFFILIISCL